MSNEALTLDEDNESGKYRLLVQVVTGIFSGMTKKGKLLLFGGNGLSARKMGCVG